LIEINAGTGRNDTLTDDIGKPTMRLRMLLMAAVLLTLSAPGAATPADVSAALSDLMTRLQLQHAKLWFAGKLGNWDLANYEAGQIEAGLEMAGKMLPDPAAIGRVRDQLQAARRAIGSKDAAAFTRAYAAVTNECNGCHRAGGYPWITIQLPLTPPVPNQVFTDQLAEGRAFARASCATCHVVSDATRDAAVTRPAAPSFPEMARRPSFSADGVRQFLLSNHRRLGSERTMPNPRLSEYQIEAVVAYLETLRAGQSR
jgi:mono/diheme cytochrome c family protein